MEGSSCIALGPVEGVVHGIGIANMRLEGLWQLHQHHVEMMADGSVMVHVGLNEHRKREGEELCHQLPQRPGHTVDMVAVMNYDTDGGCDTGVSAGSTQTKRADQFHRRWHAVDMKNQMMTKRGNFPGRPPPKLTYAPMAP